MTRFKNDFIGKARVISPITIFVFLVTNMNSCTQEISAQTGGSSPSQNTPPIADNKTIKTNINTPIKITLTANSSPPPTVNDIHIQTNTNTPVEFALTGTDPDPRDVLKFFVVNLPQHGNLTNGITPNSVLYTPDIGFSGTDSFTYKATDSQGVNSRNLATVIMTINGSYHSSSSDSSNSINSSSNMVDPFGIREIYPTKAGGEQWFMDMSDITQDPRASFEDSNTGLTRNPDGSWKVSSTEVRFNVLPSSGYHHELINTLECLRFYA